MIKTKSMMVRDNTATYVNSSGVIVGTVPTCAKHIFTKRNLASTVLTDPIGSVVVTDASFSASGNGFVADTNANLAVTSGSFGSFGTSDFLMVLSGQAKSTTTNALRFSVGTSASDSGATLLNNNSTAVCQLATSGVALDEITTLGALTLDTDYSLFIAFDRDGNGQARRYTTAAAASATQNTALTNTASVSFTPLDGVIGLKGLIYGAGLYRFAGGLPTNWVAWSIWLAEQWKAGNYVVAPPAWANL